MQVAQDASIVNELEAQRPARAGGVAQSSGEDHLIERGIVGLYRWYTERAQATRNWHPDRSFDWRCLHTDHSPEMRALVEGFFAIEQFVPDYTSKIVQIVRASHGRSGFQLRWGAEEQKHADLWRNVLLFTRARTPHWIQEYEATLRTNVWRLPWDDPLHMSWYVVVQERATQVTYQNTAAIARGEAPNPVFSADTDQVLARVAQTVAIDEAAHYNFFP
jgi:acyl-[acyl-carrier protein] desaturase